MSAKKTILITGACGSLGRAAVLEFARAGYLVYAADLAPFEWDERSVIPVRMDVTDEASVLSAAELVGRDGGLDVILHMAGLYTMDAFSEISAERLESIFGVNLMGVIRVNRIFLPLVRKNGGRIIITASELAVLDPLPFNGIYSVTKRALDGYAHSLALELDLIGTRVTTIYPGAYGDGMTKAAVKAMERMSESSRLYPDVAERFRKIVMNETGSARPPEALAVRIRRIAEKKRPRFRYFMNNSFKLKLFSALPMGMQAFILGKLLMGGEKKC